MLKIKQFEFSPFGINTYLAIDEDTKEAAIIDPGMSNASERMRFDEYVEQSGAKITQIINTHLHIDHCFGMSYVKNKYGVKLKGHPDDAPLGSSMASQYQIFGMAGGENVAIDVPLKDGDTIKLGNTELKVIHVPGHTPGGIAIYCPSDNVVFTGDTLFNGSVGRTDLPGGNMQELLKSVKEKLYALPPQTLVLPGHNGPTTIEKEKRTNPFTI